MHDYSEKTLLRDCEAIRIPSGEPVTLAAGTRVIITQALGGSYTVETDMGLARVSADNADALGLEVATATVTPAATANVPVDDKAVWDQLRTCYDPEIPVNIVDLGLVYDCLVTPQEGKGAKVDVKMTLTAPGCGMGPTIAAEAKQKIMSVPGVDDADVELVWDPPWNQAMISEVGKMKLGLI
ncbi:MAG TPA: putative Fe-S cluster assembly protein SufT [Chthoniobacteraceae bacterium]|nr:putative Fe-S cluster assembly protein SufT [Chthoniobacteraceae bacterium]